MLQCIPMHMPPPANQPGQPADLSGSHIPTRPLPQQPGLDIKPRLTKDQHEFLEGEFQKQHKPSTVIKKGYAESLQVPIEKINNWFQNRRAKVKQDAKKMAMNPLNAMAPPGVKKSSSKNDRMPYLSDQAHHFSSTPNLHQALSYPDTQGPYGSSRLASSQLNLSLDFGQSLQSISESGNAASQINLMDSLVASGYNFSPEHGPASDEDIMNSGFSDGLHGFSDVSAGMDHSFGVTDSSALYGISSGNDSAFAMSHYSNSASASAHNLGVYTTSPDVSGVSTSQSSAPSLSSTGPNMSSNISNLNEWTDETQSPGTLASGSQHEGSIGDSVSNYGPLDSASPQDMAIWSAGPTPDPSSLLGANPMYMHNDGSSQSLLTSATEQGDGSTMRRSPFAAASPFDRRPSSVSIYTEPANSDSLQSSNLAREAASPTPRRLGEFPSSIASRRQRPRPAAIGTGAPRSSSYSSGLPASPGHSHTIDPDQTLRRIRSSGVVGSRIQKNGTVSAQRSPLAMSFPDLSNTNFVSPGTAAPGNNLAPPTPMTPNGMRYGSYPGGEMTLSRAMEIEREIENGMLEDVPVAWNFDFGGVKPSQSNESPPYTPMDKMRLGSTSHSRVGSASLYQEAPPQSAPATQQMFAGPTLTQFPHAFGGSRLANSLGSASASRQHSRSPSMPVVTTGMAMEQHAAYAVPMSDEDSILVCSDHVRHHHRGVSAVGHSTPSQLSSSVTPADFEVHEYTPPEGPAQANSSSRAQETQHKNYVFSNSGLKDYQAE